jgi:hypothetical protein
MGSAFLLRRPFPCAEPVHPLCHGALSRIVRCTSEFAFVCELTIWLFHRLVVVCENVRC